MYYVIILSILYGSAQRYYYSLSGSVLSFLIQTDKQKTNKKEETSLKNKTKQIKRLHG